MSDALLAFAFACGIAFLALVAIYATRRIIDAVRWDRLWPDGEDERRPR